MPVEPIPRLTSITGVSRALLTIVGTDEAMAILIAQFGWDVAFSAVARIEGPQGAAALWRAVETLCCDSDAASG